MGKPVSPRSSKGEVVTYSNGWQDKLPEIPYPMFCVPQLAYFLKIRGNCAPGGAHITPLTYGEWNKCLSPNEVPISIQEMGRVELIWGFPV